VCGTPYVYPYPVEFNLKERVGRRRRFIATDANGGVHYREDEAVFSLRSRRTILDAGFHPVVSVSTTPLSVSAEAGRQQGAAGCLGGGWWDDTLWSGTTTFPVTGQSQPSWSCPWLPACAAACASGDSVPDEPSSPCPFAAQVVPVAWRGHQQPQPLGGHRQAPALCHAPGVPGHAGRQQQPRLPGQGELSDGQGWRRGGRPGAAVHQHMQNQLQVSSQATQLTRC